MKTVIIAPLTSTLKRYPVRVNCSFQGHAGQIALDHCRGVDKSRLKKSLGFIDDMAALALCGTLLQTLCILKNWSYAGEHGLKDRFSRMRNPLESI